MRPDLPLPLLRLLLVIGMAGLLAACGGGSSFPVVTAVRAGSVMYGKTATLYIGGQDLRSSIVADTGGQCAGPSYASTSTTEVLVLNCLVTAVGEIPLALTAADGQLLYKTVVNVPKPQVALYTSEGTITMELEPAAAPVSVRNFLSYVGSGYYSSTLFHRVIQGFVIQGGGYTSGMQRKPGQLDPIALESQNGLSNIRGAVAMARTSVPNSATSEFFVNLVDNSATLDYRSTTNPGYAVFGSVIQGMDVVDAIAGKATGVVSGFTDVPLTDINVNLALQVR